jgi:hypothetical protein
LLVSQFLVYGTVKWRLSLVNARKIHLELVEDKRVRWLRVLCEILNQAIVWLQRRICGCLVGIQEICEFMVASAITETHPASIFPHSSTVCAGLLWLILIKLFKHLCYSGCHFVSYYNEVLKIQFFDKIKNCIILMLISLIL